MYTSIFQIKNDKYDLYEDNYLPNKNINHKMFLSRIGLNKKMTNSLKQNDSYKESLNSSHKQNEIKDNRENISL